MNLNLAHDVDEPQLDAPGLDAHISAESSDAMGGAGQGLNNIKVVYHPSSGKQPDIYTFEHYCSAPKPPALDSSALSPSNDSDKRPWHPFPTRTDFELAEVMLDGHLNRKQIDRVLSVFWKAIPNNQDQSDLSDDRLTIKNSADLSHIWDHALKARAMGVRTFDSSLYH